MLSDRVPGDPVKPCKSKLHPVYLLRKKKRGHVEKHILRLSRQIEDRDLSTRSRTGPPSWDGRSIILRRAPEPHSEQAQPDLEKLSHHPRGPWQDREAASVYQKSLARLREGRDRN